MARPALPLPASDPRQSPTKSQTDEPTGKAGTRQAKTMTTGAATTNNRAKDKKDESSNEEVITATTTTNEDEQEIDTDKRLLEPTVCHSQ